MVFHYVKILQNGVWGKTGWGSLPLHFFSVYIDDIVKFFVAQRIGCYVSQACACIYLYADDILLLAPSVDCLQKLFTLCKTELNILGLKINESKTVCMRIGPRYQNSCANLITAVNKELQWVDEIRYLGVYLVSSFKFKCSFDNAKKYFYRSFNAVFGRLGGKASRKKYSP
jgi:hypothetical protein